MTESNRKAVLSIRGLTIDLLGSSAERPHAVSSIDLDVGAGEVVCIVGESGSGKSMTAHAIMGLLPKEGIRRSAGEIVLNGVNLTDLDDVAMRKVRGRDVAMIFQEPLSSLNPLHRIGRQIEEVMLIHGMNGRRERRQNAARLLTEVGLTDVDRMMASYPFQLSGGQRQRAMIAMALALNPSLLVADEPTTALDVTAQSQVLRLLKEIQSKIGMAIVFITHDFGVVAEIADKVVVMQGGVVVERGAVADILRQPKHPYTRQLIEAVTLTGHRKAPIADDRPILEVRSLSKSFTRRHFIGGNDTVWAARGVSFSVARGRTIGIVGESGSGKSTTGRCIVRLLRQDAGTIHFDGHEISALSDRAFRAYRPRVQMIFQDPYSSLNPRHQIGHIITEAPILHGLARAEAQTRCLELLALVGLDASAARRYPHEFSGGQRQRIGIARALALDPEVLIADEPVSALDVSVQAQVLRLLEDLRQRFNLALVFITHDLRVAQAICDEILVMRRGEIVEAGPTKQVFEHPAHEYTRALLASVPGQAALASAIRRDCNPQ